MPESQPLRRVAQPTATATTAHLALGLLVAVATSFAWGGVTSIGQTVLPDALHSFANSVSGWTILTALTVWMLRRGVWPSALYGAASFVALVLGYQVVSGWRGYFYDPTFWVVIGAAAGPFVGAAAAWLRANGWRAAAGTALLAGIGLGEAAYGLTVVADTTSPVYWTLVGVASLALCAGTLTRNSADRRVVGITVGGTALIAAAFLGASTAM